MGDQTSSDSYFVPLGAGRFRATAHVGGAWFPDEQHIAPMFGLLTHLVEVDRDERRADGLIVARLSFDILGRVGLQEEVSTRVRVVRPGRNVELVEVVASQHNRDAVMLRAWLMKPATTDALAVTPLNAIPAPEDVPKWDPTQLWTGGFIESIEVRRIQREPGDALFWVRTPVPLIAGTTSSRLAYAAGLLDAANGMAARAHPSEVAFPNVDLTAHFFAVPDGEWLGFDTGVTFGAAGMGLTNSVIHDYRGPIGVVSQMLTVRPKA